MQPFDVTLDRPMPSAPDAERSLLGAIIIRNEVYYRVPNIKADSFSRDENRAIFEAITYLIEVEHVGVDAVTIATELTRRGNLDLVGGFAYVSSLIDVVPDVANASQYGATIERMAKKRANLIAGNALMRASLQLVSEPEEDAAMAMTALSPQTTREDAQARPLAEVLAETYDAMDGLRKRGESLAMECVGWPTLNEYKIFTPSLFVTGGPTKTGKSSLMLAFARGLAANGHPVAIFSLESSARELSLRHIAAVTDIPHRFVRDWRTFDDSNFTRVAECRKSAAKTPIFLTQNMFDVEAIVMEVRRLKVMHGLKAVFVDYIQNVSTKRRVDNREERLHEISKTLLATAIEQGVHVHALSQLADGADDADHLTVRHLAYAKSIAKSARGVLLFRRPKVQNPRASEKSCYVDFSIAANNEERTLNYFEAHFCEITQRFGEGTCEQNDCRSLRSVERKLFT